jgi:hypothetical protein
MAQHYANDGRHRDHRADHQHCNCDEARQRQASDRRQQQHHCREKQHDRDDAAVRAEFATRHVSSLQCGSRWHARSFDCRPQSSNDRNQHTQHAERRDLPAVHIELSCEPAKVAGAKVTTDRTKPDTRRDEAEHYA